MFNPKLKHVFLAFLVCIFVATGGYAQVQTGGITGSVTDPEQNPIPGVNVNLSSPAMIQGQQVVQTDKQGFYRFSTLNPGVYRLEFTLQGFRSLVREGIVVRLGSTISVNASLEVARVEEALVISGETPVVDVKQTTIGSNFSQEMLRDVPSARDIWSLMEQTPAVVTDKFNVGGIESGLQSLFAARGGSWTQNQFNLDGVNVTDPSATGASMFYYDFDTFEEVQVTTGATSAEVSVPGVFLNIVTKSGGNEFHGGGKFLYEDEALQGHNLTDELINTFGLTQDQQDKFERIDYLSDASVQLGGPIKKDKIWFFGAYRDHRIHRGVPFYPVAEGTDIKYLLLKTTVNLNPANTVTGMWGSNWYFKPDRGAVDFGGAFVTPESTWIEDDKSDVYQAQWNYVPKQQMILDTRASYVDLHFPLNLKTDKPGHLDLYTGLITQGSYYGLVLDRRRLQINGSLSYYADNIAGGNHDFKFGYDFQASFVDNKFTANEDLFYLDFGNVPGLVFLWNTPVFTKNRVHDFAFFAQDSYRRNKLTVDLGFRINLGEGFNPAQGSPGGRFSQARSFEEQRDIPNWKNIAPRLGFVYDVKGNGSFAIKGNFARYYNQLGVDVPDFQNFGGLGGQLFTWQDLNGNGVLDQGEQGVLLSQFGGAFGPNEQGVQFVDPDYKRPYTDEVTAGIDTELSKDLLLSVDFIYRKDKDLQEDINTGVPFSAYTPVVITDPGPDNILGTPDDGGQITVFNQDPSTLGQDRFLLTNPPGLKSDYRGVEIQLNKRFSSKWQMVTGLTIGRANTLAKGSGNFIPGGAADTGFTSGLLDNPNTLINADGRSFWDRPVIFKLAGSYVAPWDVVIGAFLKAQSGQPFPRQIQITDPQFNQGVFTIFAEPVGATRLPSVKTLDLSFEKKFPLQTGTLGVSLDVFNIFNSNTVLDAQTLSGPTFLVPKVILAPRVARLGVRYDF